MTVTSGQLPWSLLRGLDTMRSQKHLCDIVLKAGGKKFYGHKAILGAVSPFFSAIFTSSFKESKNNILELQETDADSLSAVLDFIYTAQLKESCDMIRVLELAEFLQICSLKCICAEYLKQNINTMNCENVYKVAETLDLEELKEVARKFMIKLDIGEWSHDSGALTQVLIVSGGHDWEGRCLRTAECLTKVGDAWRWKHCRPPRHHEFEEASDTLAVMKHARANAAFVATNCHLYVIGGKINSSTFLSSVERYCLEDNEWTELAPLPLELTYSAATFASGNTIFVIGGQNNSDWDSRVWIHNIEANTWYQGPDLPEKRIQHAAVNWHNSIYVLGGKTESEMAASSTVLVLESGSSTWMQVSSMQRPRAQFACTLSQGCIYVVGGTDGIHTLAHAEKYDLMKNQWTTLANYSLPLEASCLATMSFQQESESVVCIGGHDGTEPTNIVEKLGVSGDQWHYLPELNTPRSSCTVAVLNTNY